MHKIFFILLFSFTSIHIHAQKNAILFAGATASAYFGQLQDRVEISPLVGFRVLPKTYLGASATFSYYSTSSIVLEKQQNTTDQQSVQNKLWYTGGAIFARYIPFQQKNNALGNVYLQASYEALWGVGKHTNNKNEFEYQTMNYTPFVGIGFKQSIIKNFSLGALLSFKLNNELHSPYRNPIIRISFEF